MHIMFMPNSPSPPSATIWSFLSDIFWFEGDYEANQILARPLATGLHPTKRMPENHQLLEVIRNRWSPRSFNGKEVETSKLKTLFEAASWASSCFGEEPWRFVIAT